MVARHIALGDDSSFQAGRLIPERQFRDQNPNPSSGERPAHTCAPALGVATLRRLSQRNLDWNHPALAPRPPLWERSSVRFRVIRRQKPSIPKFWERLAEQRSRKPPSPSCIHAASTTGAFVSVQL